MVKLSVINHDRVKYDNIILQINPSLIVISDLDIYSINVTHWLLQQVLMQNVFSYYEITFIQGDHINYYKLTDKYTKYMNLLHMMELKPSHHHKNKEL
jgi:hypothetical protein